VAVDQIITRSLAIAIIISSVAYLKIWIT